jgi:glycosyltransferase involved in cell wall biosynthesis
MSGTSILTPNSNQRVDLVMWTKNGAETLPAVLARIAAVIPDMAVNQRVIVDDQSSDSTREIARRFGWKVIPNEGTGISDGANTALRQVDTDTFISFEQDLLLAFDWWQKLPRYMSDFKVAIASGVRFVYYPPVLKKLQEYTAANYKNEDQEGKFFPYVKTLDNTIYRTSILRELGGFPKLAFSAGVDHVLAQRIYSAGYRWKVNYDVKSVHLRTGLADELAHNYWYGACSDQLEISLKRRPVKTNALMQRLMFTPVRGLQIALKTREPSAVFIYPQLRLAFARGVLNSRKNSAR